MDYISDVQFANRMRPTSEFFTARWLLVKNIKSYFSFYANQITLCGLKDFTFF